MKKIQNFAAFGSLRLLPGKLKKRKRERERRFFTKTPSSAYTVLRATNGQNFISKCFWENRQLIYNEESAANILEKYEKKTIIESREVCFPPPSPTLEDYLTIFHLTK